ncbi:MAG TPA: ATP-binding protein [Bryobacteraceae bacterium]|nr:ATP-binding protein [Bryobacteraceae bacterium]
MSSPTLDPIRQLTPAGVRQPSVKPSPEPAHDHITTDDIQLALLNILEDLTAEQSGFEAAQRAVLNILEDSEAEKVSLQNAQRAALNILEDFDVERAKTEAINRELEAEIEARNRAEKEITELNDRLERHVAELLAANKELESFSYSVSHDLRAPVRAMDGFSKALLEDYADKLDQEGRDHLQRVRAASLRMDQLIDGILGLSRMTRSEMRRTAVDLSGLAQTVARELQKADPDRQVELVIAPHLVVNADANLLRVVLQNLLGNAWKYTSKHPWARVEVGAAQREGEAAYFVRDDGAGFDMAYAGKLFGAFQRLHTPAEFEGTGIGLATVQRIVHRHGGNVWAEGEVEKGAAFFFTLPVNAR